MKGTQMKKFGQEQFNKYMDNIEGEYGPINLIEALRQSVEILKEHVDQAENDMETLDGHIGEDTQNLLEFELGWINEAITRWKKLGQ